MKSPIIWQFLVFTVVLIELVKSQTDLCRNPKLDSITYLSGQSVWFFTSGGYYWYIKEKQFPPGPANGKLPEGFTRGDGAFYLDWIRVCGSSSSSSDQLIYLAEKGSSGNKIIEFDTRKTSWAQTYDWNQSHIIGRSNIDDPNGQIDAMFTIRDYEVYVVQKDKYAGVDVKGLCSDPNGWAKQYQSNSIDGLQKSVDDPFDAIAVKDNTMYSFVGHKFWKSTIDLKKSKEGKIVIAKGSQQNISSNFFKFKKCPKPLSTTKSNENTVQQTTSADSTENTSSQQDQDQDQEQDQDQNQDQEKEISTSDDNSLKSEDNDQSSDGSRLFLVVLTVVAVVIVFIVIGIVLFATIGKPKPSKDVKKAGPSKK